MSIAQTMLKHKFKHAAEAVTSALAWKDGKTAPEVPLPNANSTARKMRKMQRSGTRQLHAETEVVKQAKNFESGVWKACKEGNLADLEAVANTAADDPELLKVFQGKERGPVGETPLHVCFLFYSGEGHWLCAEYLMQHYPELINALYESDLYRGEHILHMCAVYGHVEPFKKIVEVFNGDFKTPKCTGSFFSPGDRGHFGGTVLAFAVSTGQRQIVEYLIEKGADPNDTDHWGNTCLHMCVMHDQKELYEYLVKDVKKAETYVKNNDGLTPLLLSVKLDKKDMFDFMLELRKELNWAYGPVRCVLYPLDELDNPDHGEQDALTVGVRYKRLNFLTSSIFIAILDNKWKQFAKRNFYLWACTEIIYVGIFLAAVYLRDYETTYDSHERAHDIAREICDVIVLIGAALHLFFESTSFVREPKDYLRGSKKMAHLTVLAASSLSVCIYPLSRNVVHPASSAAVTATAGIFWCIYLLYFARGFKIVGPYAVTLYQMVIGDVLRFLLIWLILVMGFSQAFYILFRGTGVEDYSDIGHTVFTLISLMLGNYDTSIYVREFPPGTAMDTLAGMAATFGQIYAVFMQIVLINLLIAMMARTFKQTAKDAEKEWRRQWADIILQLDRNRKWFRKWLGPFFACGPCKQWFEFKQYDDVLVRPNGHKYLMTYEVDTAAEIRAKKQKKAVEERRAKKQSLLEAAARRRDEERSRKPESNITYNAGVAGNGSAHQFQLPMPSVFMGMIQTAIADEYQKTIAKDVQQILGKLNFQIGALEKKLTSATHSMNTSMNGQQFAEVNGKPRRLPPVPHQRLRITDSVATTMMDTTDLPAALNSHREMQQTVTLVP